MPYLYIKKRKSKVYNIFKEKVLATRIKIQNNMKRIIIICYNLKTIVSLYVIMNKQKRKAVKIISNKRKAFKMDIISLGKSEITYQKLMIKISFYKNLSLFISLFIYHKKLCGHIVEI